MGDAYRSKSTFDADLFCSVAGHKMTICRSEGNKGDDIGVVNSLPAIEVRNAHKSFGSKIHVLQNLNLKVETGSIYSLLGSSGCGKTTVLSCIVGLQKLDRGHINVFGEPPGSGCGVPGPQVGYMPQEISLYNEFSIEESLNYYGRLYGMSSANMKDSMESILRLLELPCASRRICTLSGGQRRRVSFAIAVIHRPPLLILDEPTVGVDPLLRESIWSFLRQLVSMQRTSVLITTHYIQEANYSTTIGVMRSGRLLVEASPQDLMAQFKLPLLEQIVLTLCQNDAKSTPEQCHKNLKRVGMNSSCEDIENPKEHHVSLQKYTRGINYYSNIFSIGGGKSMTLKDGMGFARKCDKESNSKSSCDSSLQDIGKNRGDADLCCRDAVSSINRIKALTIKNFVVLLRSVPSVHFVVPAIQIVLICLAIGPDPKKLGFGVINEEMIANGFPTDAPCVPNPGCGVALSCRYLSMLPNESLHLKSYTNVSDALEDIRMGTIWGYLQFPKNFSAYLIDRGGNPAFALDETYDGSRITFEMDMSNQQIGHNLKRIFIEAFYTFIVQVTLDCNLNPRQVELPLNFKTPIYGSDGTSFSEFLAPSVFLGLLFFFPLCSSGIAYISEKKSGTLFRSLVAGVTTGEIMVAFLISQIAVLMTQSGLAFLILNVVFKIPILGSVPLGLSLAVLVGVGGMSMGFLISVICQEEIQAVLLAIGFFFPNFLLAGMVWPIQGMPIVLQYIAYLL
ncbi:ABC transporter G family member 23 [Folsomia candida]|uniref:ABC transporter G family member 23 n=2 Tax=Folsomia candida TaxID=158441 RepID=A0A226F651_FOLCA|nr:ABC transporter G family member 23 [Folsomia candida]